MVGGGAEMKEPWLAGEWFGVAGKVNVGGVGWISSIWRTLSRSRHGVDLKKWCPGPAPGQ